MTIAQTVHISMRDLFVAGWIADHACDNWWKTPQDLAYAAEIAWQRHQEWVRQPDDSLKSWMAMAKLQLSMQRIINALTHGGDR